MLGILARARILKNFLGQDRQSQHFIHLSEKQQTAITGYFGALEFQLHTWVKLDRKTSFLLSHISLSVFLLQHRYQPLFISLLS